jgi:SpoVK/Ycf46/Vps4 family AAA+-type ATPase
VTSVAEELTVLEPWAEYFMINLWMTPNAVIADAESELPVEVEWHCIDGFQASIETVRSEFVSLRQLERMTMYVTGPPASGKTYYAKQLAEYYNLPHITVSSSIELLKASGNELQTHVDQVLA